MNPKESEILAAIDRVLERLREDGRLEAWAAGSRAAGARSTPTLGIRNERAPFPGVLSGGQPDLDQLARAAEAGFKTVVNLRGPGEQGEIPDEATRIEALGMRYVAIPIVGGDDLSLENAQRLRQVLAEPETLPALVHCASGNRVGALFALQAFHLDGQSATEALEIGKRAGLTRDGPLLREQLGLAGDAP